VLVGKQTGNKRLGRHRCRREDNTKMHLERIKWKKLDCIHVAQDQDKWWDVVNTVMNFLAS
jgi:hypothetical protein